MRMTLATKNQKKIEGYDVLMSGLSKVLKCSTVPRTVIAQKAGLSNSQLHRCMNEEHFKPEHLVKAFKAVIEECNYNKVQ